MDTADLAAALDVVRNFVTSFRAGAPVMTKSIVLENSDLFESMSRWVQQGQIIAAHAIDAQNLHATGDTDTVFTWYTPDPAAGSSVDLGSSGTIACSGTIASDDTHASCDAIACHLTMGSSNTGSAADTSVAAVTKKSPYRSIQEFLVARLRISYAEANRRVHLGRDLLPGVSLTGVTVQPRFPDLAEAAASGDASADSLYRVVGALHKMRLKTSPESLTVIEQALAEQTTLTDPDCLTPQIRAWILGIDQDGTAPSEAELTARQGVHYLGLYRGLHHLEIHADQGQYETLLTVMNTGTNPRILTDVEKAMDPRTRPQKLLDTLVTGCSLALQTDGLPQAGGHRPQIMATIDYKELFEKLQTGRASGRLTFTGAINAQSIRALACDANIIPVVLGGRGEILNYGRRRRYHSRAQRRAITARDKGCIRPGCTMPAAWCEVHHVDFWENYGGTDVNAGVLTCSFDHHMIHAGEAKIVLINKIPHWMASPRVDPAQKPRRNTFFNPPGLPVQAALPR